MSAVHCLSSHREGRLRPCPAIEAMGHRSGHAILRMRLGRHRPQGQRDKSGHDELPVLPASLLPFRGPGIARRDAPQFERCRPQAKAENDLRGLGRRVRPGKGAGRGGGRRTDRRHPARIARRRVLRLLADGVGVARGHEIQGLESVDLGEGDLVGDAAQMRCDPIGRRCPDSVADFGGVATDRDMTVGSDLDGSQYRIPSGAVVLAGAGDARPDENSRLPPARLLLRALVPDWMLLQLIQDLRGADRHAVSVSGHDPAAGRERVAAPELESGRAAAPCRSHRPSLRARSSTARFHNRASSPRSRRASGTHMW